jgi:formiminotetrahydrofolate cyclodeaminase
VTDVLGFSIRDFITATEAKQPTPGGGAVAGVCGALAAALAAMALEYTIGKKAFAAHDAELRNALAQFHRAAEMLQELVTEDIAAYEALSTLLKLPEAERLAHPNHAAAVVAAIRVPQTVAGFAINILEHCLSILDKTNKFLISDLGIAAVYAHATVHASELNVRINLPLLANSQEARALQQDMSSLAQRADEVYSGFRSALLQKV